MAYASYKHNGTRGVGEVAGDVLIPLTGVSEIGIQTPVDVLARAPRRNGDAVVIR